VAIRVEEELLLLMLREEELPQRLAINRGGMLSSPATTNVSRGEATQESVWA
jgi:hypothetical protein